MSSFLFSSFCDWSVIIACVCNILFKSHYQCSGVGCDEVLLRGNCETAIGFAEPHFILETYVRKVSPYQGEGMIWSSYFSVCGTGQVGKRNVSCFVSSWIVSACTRDEAWREQCVSLPDSSLLTCAPNECHTWAISSARCLYIEGKKR